MGRAGKIETFAGGLNTPDAVAPYKRGAIVFSIPNILELEDQRRRTRRETRGPLWTVRDARHA
jgi:hypothetical protein